MIIRYSFLEGRKNFDPPDEVFGMAFSDDGGALFYIDIKLNEHILTGEDLTNLPAPELIEPDAKIIYWTQEKRTEIPDDLKDIWLPEYLLLQRIKYHNEKLKIKEKEKEKFIPDKPQAVKLSHLKLGDDAEEGINAQSIPILNKYKRLNAKNVEDAISELAARSQGSTTVISKGGSSVNPSWENITGKPENFMPSAHAASHNSGGADAISHQNISGAGSNTHAQIDSHISSTSNPHSVTADQVGLGADDAVTFKSVTTSDTAASVTAEITSAATNTAASPIIVRQKTSADMADGFGSAVNYHVEDDAGVSSSLGAVGFIRKGADNTGTFRVYVSKAGTTSTQFSVDADGIAYIGKFLDAYLSRSASQTLTIGPKGTVEGTLTVNGGLLKSTSDGLAAGTGARVTRDGNSPYFNLERLDSGAGNMIGFYAGVAPDSAANRDTFSRIAMYQKTATSGSEAGELRITNMVGGSFVDVAYFDENRFGMAAAAPHSTIQSGGSLAAPVVSKSTNYTMTASNYHCLATGGAGGITITLPAASGCTGRMYVITKIDSGAGTVVVDANSAEMINGALTCTLGHQWDSITIHCDGSGWVIISKIDPVP